MNECFRRAFGRHFAKGFAVGVGFVITFIRDIPKKCHVSLSMRTVKCLKFSQSQHEKEKF